VKINDISGAVTMKEKAKYIGTDQIRHVVDISSLAPGIYVFSILTEKHSYSSKFIKTNNDQ
jgi:hypothetical protein